MWGTGVSSGVTRSRDPLPPDEDFKRFGGQERCPGTGSSVSTAEELSFATSEVKGLLAAQGIETRGWGGSAYPPAGSGGMGCEYGHG